MEDDLYALLDQADPQTLQLMLQALSANENYGVGKEMYGIPNPEGRNVGHTYVAASPLEHLGTLAMRMRGANEMQQAQGARAGGIQAFINAFRNRQNGLPPNQYTDPLAAAQYGNDYGSGD